MAFTPTYHQRNVNNLNKLGDNTKRMAFKWYQYCIDHGVDVLIYETIRTVEQQRKNVANGASQTMKSYHIVGQALDFCPIINGREGWNKYTTSPWKECINYAKSIGFEWGGDWKGFVDSPHLQNNYRGYGTDTFNGGNGSVDISTGGSASNNSNGADDGAPIIFNGGIGTAKVVGVTTSLNIRKGPGTNYDIETGAGDHGKVYNNSQWVVHERRNGWCYIGGWISEEYCKFYPLPNSNGGGSTGTVTADSLRVRSGAGTNYDVIGGLKNGQKVTITGQSNGWYTISFEGRTGYVSADYVSKDGGSSTSSGWGVITADVLNVRNGASTGSTVIGKLYEGNKVKLSNRVGAWWSIDFGDHGGFVSADYVREI